MQADDIALRVKFGQLHILDAKRDDIRPRRPAVGQQPDAKPLHDLRDDAADVAGADNPDGLAVHVEADQSV